MPHPLQNLGLDDGWQAASSDAGHAEAALARVVSEQRGLYLVHDGAREAWASIAGRMRHAIDAAESARPAVGDFVVLREGEVEHAKQRVIEHVLPRRAFIARKAAGKADIEQVMAANVDTVFIVCGLSKQSERELNPRRIERLAAMAWEGRATPVILLNKCDAFEDVPAMIARAQGAAPDAPVHAVSAKTGAGLDALASYLAPGRTVVLIGSSGAGKSTLANRWLGEDRLATAEVGPDGRGRHTSRARQLVRTPSGLLVIDTPGVREAGLWTSDDSSAGAGLERAFDEITALAAQCRFSDCSHTNEPACAVRAALEAGQIEAERLEAFRRLQKEPAAVRGRNPRLLHKGRRG
jgi:ribosome biogenesis GTPase